MKETFNLIIPESVLMSVFSDDTELFRSPSEPDCGDTVTIRLRIAHGSAKRAMLVTPEPSMAVVMNFVRSDGYFDWYETSIVCADTEVRYYFRIETEDGCIVCDRRGARAAENEGDTPTSAFGFTPGFHVPDWSKGALQYQIFTDRFCNGNPDNDVTDNEYYYAVGHSKHATDWDALPDDTDIRTFWGGDLQGILSKLDYLQQLGVEVLYLNPIFVSPSSHKYDTQDYGHVDPHLSVIAEDMEHRMEPWEKHNGYAPKYIKRTASKVNLESSDAFFALFCDEVHKRGMKLILDGVFNHCGSFSKWMDREGIYLNKPGYEAGAYQSVDSPYREYFRFRDMNNPKYGEYESWWGYATLPKLNYEGSEKLREEIYSIAEKWASPPYSIDGWRLDVASDLGHSPEFNHKFWTEFRRRVKKINPDLLIVAEHYGNPADWLEGDQWDTVMNYDAFMEPVSYFFTGMEKHSDEYRPDLHRNAEAFFNTMLEKMSVFQQPSLLCAMNQLSNHDHSRFLTRTSGHIGRLETSGSAAASDSVSKAMLRQAVLVQMTWPGAPTVYYADEAGQVGWTDPDNRRTYPWGHEDNELVRYHQTLARIRSRFPLLRTASVKPVYASEGVMAYGRFNEKNQLVAAFNSTDTEKSVRLGVLNIGAEEGQSFSCVLYTDNNGFGGEKEYPELCGLKVEKGEICFRLPPCSAVLFA